MSDYNVLEAHFLIAKKKKVAEINLMLYLIWYIQKLIF